MSSPTIFLIVFFSFVLGTNHGVVPSFFIGLACVVMVMVLLSPPLLVSMMLIMVFFSPFSPLFLYACVHHTSCECLLSPPWCSCACSIICGIIFSFSMSPTTTSLKYHYLPPLCLCAWHWLWCCVPFLLWYFSLGFPMQENVIVCLAHLITTWNIIKWSKFLLI